MASVAALYDVHGNLRAAGDRLVWVRGNADREPTAGKSGFLPGLDVATVVCGHTHTQFEREVAGARVVNAGMPYAEEPGAYWLLDLVHWRTPYDGAELKATREEAAAEFTARGL